MKDEQKTKKQLLEELNGLREELSKLKDEKKSIDVDMPFIEKEAFQTIINSIADAVIVADTSRRIAFMNKAATILWGYSFEELKGKTTECLYANVNDYEKQGRIRYHIGGEAKNPAFESRYRRKDGTEFTGESQVTQLRDKNSNVLGFLGIHKDITNRKRAEQKLIESEEKFRLAYENATDAIFWANPETGIIVNCNKAAEVLLEKKRSDIIGQHQRTIHPAEKAQYYEEVFRRHFEQKSTTDEEAEIITSTGRIIPVHITAAVTLLGNIPIIQGIFRDITQRKQAEEAIQKSTEEMKLFAYCVSHDLKNPAIAVHGLTKRFCKFYDDILDEKAKMYCSQILISAEQIAALVQNINTYISTRENPLHLEAINLKDLIQIIKDEFNIQLNIRQVELLAPGYVPEFKADRLSIIRVLRNLVDNAIKYGGENLSRIEIGYTDSPQFHIIFVKDDGIGIAAKDSSTIFGLFKQIKKRQDVEGTGLGLAIVKEIAGRHKGKVWLESEGSEKGVTFYMSISKSV